MLRKYIEFAGNDIFVFSKTEPIVMKLLIIKIILIGMPFCTFANESVNKKDNSSSSTFPNEDPVVKKSLNNVCFDKSNVGYRKTQKYTSYNSMSDCRDSGGRPPKSTKRN